MVQQLAGAPDRLLDYPRIGEKLEAYEPREARRIIVGNYELRYESEQGVESAWIPACAGTSGLPAQRNPL